MVAAQENAGIGDLPERTDRRWYGNVPEILLEKRGDGVDVLIEKIDQATSYPYAKDYTDWPGPDF